MNKELRRETIFLYIRGYFNPRLECLMPFMLENGVMHRVPVNISKNVKHTVELYCRSMVAANFHGRVFTRAAKLAIKNKYHEI